MNDTAGRDAGDKLLNHVATRIRRLLHQTDVLCRVGGDEFVMILRNRERFEYARLCEELAGAFREAPFVVDNQVHPLTVSLGLALVDIDTLSGKEVLAAAAAACHQAKAHGGNRVSLASDADEEQTARRTAGSMLIALRTAIDHDELVLHGQPIRPIGSKGIVAVEALVRMPGDQGRLVPPNRFLPVAERYGSIVDLDSWVVAHSLETYRRALESGGVGCEGEDCKLFINLSATSISSPGFHDRIAKLVESSGVPPGRVCFEITETGTMRDFEAALRFVAELKRAGMQFALDDFGVGLSSLSHLQRLPVDYLKIDGSLTKDVDKNALNAALVRSIAAMADALGIVTIAEHIESQAALDTLRELGIGSVQGYHIGRPRPLGDALDPEDVAATGLERRPRRVAGSQLRRIPVGPVPAAAAARPQSTIC